jgi:hypothetical protein
MNGKITLAASCIFIVLSCAATAAQAAKLRQHRTADLWADATGRLRPARVLVGDPSPQFLRYWADPAANKILRSDAQGGQVEEVAAGLNVPYGLGFDVTAQSFVWTSSGDEAVQKLSAGTQTVATLASNFDQPPVLELASEGDRQAITLVGNEIVRVTENAQSGETSVQVLMQVESPEAVHGLALDAEAGTLYIGNAVGMMAQRLRLSDNSAVQLTFTDHTPPVADPDEGETL